MKKLLSVLLLAVSLCAFAQKEDALQDVSSLNFYGVDYSAAKVFSATETPQQLKETFASINQLFITEAKKYDIGKALQKEVHHISLNAVNKVNEEIDPDQLLTTDANYTLSEQDIKKVLKALPVQQEPGIGVVFIAKLLNKAQAYATYQVVFFNTDTKEIVKEISTGGKAQGFGLRNYWAGSIYKVLKNL